MPQLVVRALCGALAGAVVYYLCGVVGGWPWFYVLPISFLIGVLIGLV